MKRTALVGVVAALALAAGDAGVAAAKGERLCVGGGQHCYATIQAAVNAARGGETIRIAPGTFAGGVTVERSVQLVGAGARRTTISGGGPVLTLGSATTSPTIEIAGVTVTGGRTSTNPRFPACGPDAATCNPGYASVTALGGGIEAFPGTTVTLVRSVVSGNRAVPALSVPSVLSMCPDGPCPVSASGGAGIDNWGTMTLIGTTVSDNHASGVQSDGGGIVDEANATLTLKRSVVTGNSVSAAPPYGRFAAGGGIFVDRGGILTVDGSHISKNTASLANSIPHPYPQQGGNTDQANAIGGGLFVRDDATATIRNSRLDKNAITVDAPLGEPFGADAALCACGTATLTLAASSIKRNTLTVNVLSSAHAGPSGPTALEADGNATIEHSRISGNMTTVTTPTGDAGALGAVAFFFGGTVTPTIDDSTISANTSTASAPTGKATIQGAGITNNGPLVLSDVRVRNNYGTATGQTGSADGGGIWNGVLFGGPTSPLTLQDSHVTGNVLTAAPALTIRGAGIFSPSFPLTLENSTVTQNTPDQCFGC